MKRFFVLFAFCLIYKLTLSQKFEKNISISPLLTIGSNSADNSRVPIGSHISFGYSGAIQGFLNITDRFSLGAELDYTYANIKLISDYGASCIPESTIYYESKLNRHSVNMPIFLRFTTVSNWFYNIGFGGTYLFNSETSVDLVSIEWMGDDKSSSSISDKDDRLDNKLSPILSFGFGKKFEIGKTRLYSEVRYNIVAQDFDFKHIGVSGNYVSYNYKPQYFAIRFGVNI